MLSMQGVSSTLIARNESWVRKQASALVRHLPSNVEKADLIQVGLIAVAQAALAFKWEGDHDSEEAKEAFVRYARLRVKGAMLDELRQMDSLGRAHRRKIKVIQIARERWLATHGAEPGLADLSRTCGLSIDEISKLELAARMAQTESLSEDDDGDDPVRAPQPATPKDEVEARVDTAIVIRRLERFFTKLPARDRQVIDACLGIGMTPVELAAELRVTPSAIWRFYKAACGRIARHFLGNDQRALGRQGFVETNTPLDTLIDMREAELEQSTDLGPWGALIEEALTAPVDSPAATTTDDEPWLVVDSTTRWA
ncbi:MAG: sigma-70 family RNA polymerase sigma factor [Rhizobacter sp.]